MIDLSCRRKDDTWFIAMNKWQTFTDMELCRGMSIMTFGSTEMRTTDQSNTTRSRNL